MNTILTVVDGGGTHTRLWIVSVSLADPLSTIHTLYSYTSPSLKSHIEKPSHYANKVFELIDYTSKKINISIDNIHGIIIGSSGIGNNEIADRIAAEFFDILPSEKQVVICQSDVALTLVAQSASLTTHCILLNIGTGSIAIGRFGETTLFRAGGYGLPYSDIGSGAWLEQQIVARIIHLADCGEFDNEVVQEFMRHLPINNFSNIREAARFIQANHREVQRVVNDILNNEYLNKHPLICNLFDDVALHGAQLIYAVWKQMMNYRMNHLHQQQNIESEENDVVPLYLHGTLALNDYVVSRLLDSIQEMFGGKVRYQSSQGDAVVGGVLLYSKYVKHANQ